MNNAIIVINNTVIPQHRIKEIRMEFQNGLIGCGWYIIIKTDSEEYNSSCYKTITKCEKTFKALCKQLGTCIFIN